MIRIAPVLLLAATAACRADAEPITEPRQLTENPFRYPEELWDAGVEGQSVVAVFISDSGRVDTVRIERSSGHAAFDSSAVQGARTLRFEPARQGTAPIAVWRTLPVEFELDTSVTSPDTSRT